ncbi:hypothetical protein [Streptomyces sp. Qhu_M48]|uniref:hypothetical protein n=1 Tax=Streptomyces sp. Qhu_M48 TaxID=3435889 RepID=UPI003F503044
MISEPEYVGGTTFDTVEVLTEEKPPRPPRTGRPWLWAVGGAVLASAVWGGGLYAYERKTEPGPDLGGYREVESVCEAAELKALSGVLGKRGSDGAGPRMNDPAVHEASCSLSFGSPDSGYDAQLTYTLHKVIDPGPEFAARSRYYNLTTTLDGIGEMAFFDDRGGEGAEIRILDGQAELALSLYRGYSVDEDGNETGNKDPLDLSGIEVPMSQDMLSLMAALRKAP